MKASILTLVGVLVLLQYKQALAQPGSPMSFVGAGVSRGADDSDNRLSRPYNPDARARRNVLWADASVRGSRWLAVGGEVALLEPVSGHLTTRDAAFNQRHSERLVAGLIRVRAARTGRVSLDLVGGPGILLGHYEASAYDGRVTTTTSTDTRQLAWTGGADISAAVVRGAGLAGIVRVYRLGRGGSNSALPFQVASTRVFAGVGVRLGM